MPGSFGTWSGPVPIADELRGELVASIGAHDPPRVVVVPFEISDPSVEQHVVVEIELLADALAVLEDLGTVRVLLGRHVPGLLEQRHVHERRRVALRAGIPVPVPRTAEVAALLDHPDVGDAGLLQPCAGEQAGEAAADERERHMIVLRFALDDRKVRIVEVVGELILQLQVLVVAVGPQPLRPLLGVPPPQCFLVDVAHACLPRARL